MSAPSAPRHRSPHRVGAVLGCTGLLLSLGIAGVSWRYLRDQREGARQLAAVQTRNLAQSISASVSATLLRVDLVLQLAVDQMERSQGPGGLDLEKAKSFLVHTEARLQEAVAIRVTDREGRILLGHGGDPELFVTDRDFWKPLKEGTHPDRHLSPPTIGRLTQRWVIFSARRYRKPDGQFGGVVFIPVFLDHFQKALDGYDLGAFGTLTLRDEHLGFIARSPKVLQGWTPAIGDQAVTPELRRFASSGAKVSTYEAVPPYDQRRRMFTLRRLEQAPLWVVAGLAEEDYLAPWKRDHRRVLWIAGLTLGALWGGLALAYASWRRHLRHLEEEARSREALAQAADQLRQNETRLRAAAHLARLGYWEDDHAGQMRWSEELYGIHGLDPALGPPSFERFVEHLHPEDRDTVIETYHRHLASQDASSRSLYRILSPEGGERVIHTLFHTTRDGEGRPLLTCGTDQDITEQAHAAEALRRSEQRFHTAFERLPMALGIGRLETGEFLLVNRALETLSGFSRKELLGRRSTELGLWAVPEDRDRVKARLEAGEEVVDFETRLRRRDGTEVPISYSGAILQLGTERCLLSGCLDISARKRAEEAAAHSMRQLFQSQKMESLGSLAGGVAHDMNNVLSAILGLANLAGESAQADATLRRQMETIALACERGRSLVQGLLGFARCGLEESTVLDLNPLVHEQVALLSRTTLQRVKIQAALDPHPCLVLGEAGALSHLLMNLCINAIDAMPEGGTLTLRTWRDPDGGSGMEVRDTGCGMTPDVRARALDPFFTTKPVGKGTGLGLSIAYTTVQAHRGTLSLESVPGEGTRVQVRFPAAAPEGPAPGGAPGPALGSRALRVLLVDDDPLVRESGGQLLEVLGCQPVLVSSGEEAVALLDREARFDAVLLDVNMPGMSGLEVAPRILEQWPGTPILFATGRVDAKVMDTAGRLPGVRVFPKPYGLKELREVLGTLRP